MLHAGFAIVLTAAFSTASFAEKAASIDDAKKVIEARLQQLKPTGFSERQVIFKELRAGQAQGGSYPFQVTAVIRDYGSGNPATQFYGETCVGRINRSEFTLRQNSYGSWVPQGRFTVSLGPDYECRKNPSEGTSSIPLESLR